MTLERSLTDADKHARERIQILAADLADILSPRDIVRIRSLIINAQSLPSEDLAYFANELRNKEPR